ncbi:sulfite oxidase-like oxidoreductase [Planctomycetota bacterium]|nr:sulfite oxidase-like oxidoreductase [Planctomycetota bacterium]
MPDVPTITIQTHPEGQDRLPADQHLTTHWPVLTYGPTPLVSTADWRLRIFGAVEEPLELDWESISKLVPFVRIQADLHCVTTWSIHGMVWGGWRVADLLALARPTADATHVLQHATGGYTTNVDLEGMLDKDVLIACEANSAPLDSEHGGPARVVVPKRWAWKGAKWVSALEVLTSDRRGFWEVNGYHNHGDPWGEGGERYSHQEKAVETRKAGNALRRRKTT